MATFVLVHGAWHGAWCWRRVLPRLWSAGHRAHAVTLGGVGERAHEPAASITLDTHLADVAAVLEAEELQDAVLVGHSYGGLLVTGVAARHAARVRHVVYLDGVLPRSGESWSSGHPPAVRETRREAIRATSVIPPPDPAVYGLTGADAAWVSRRQTPQPGAVYDAPLHFDAGALAAVPRSFVGCIAPALATIDSSRERARREPGIRYVQLATGHDPMISAPDDVSDLLLGLT
jgi:pimeloyl-ACP methyl ester carboxylesterase